MEKQIVNIRETKSIENGALRMNASTCVAIIFAYRNFGIMSHLFHPTEINGHINKINYLLSQKGFDIKDLECFIAWGNNRSSVYNIWEKNLLAVKENLQKTTKINQLCTGGDYSRVISLDTQNKLIRVLSSKNQKEPTDEKTINY